MTQEILKEIFDYKEGMLFWKKRIAPCIRIGVRAGTERREGYRNVNIYKKYYLEHRIVWMFHNGEIPKGKEIDHKDEVKANNKIENLRLANRFQNSVNVSATKNSKTGLKGAAFHKRDRKWFSSIKVNGKRKYLGYFDTAKEAHEAYKKAAIQFHGEFANY